MNLGKPNFQLDGFLHKRLHSFLASVANTLELGTRLPHDLSTNQCTYFINWKPYGNDIHLACQSASVALGNFLNEHKHLIVSSLFIYSFINLQVKKVFFLKMIKHIFEILTNVLNFNKLNITC